MRSLFFRRFFVACFAACFVFLAFAVFIFLPGQTTAQTAVPLQFDVLTQPAQPPAPPPLNPPITTPEPNTAVADAPSNIASSDLEVIPFQPRLNIQRGEMGALAGSANKPADQTTSGLDKPSGPPAGPDEPYQAPDFDGILATQGWTLQLYEDFEGLFPDQWILEDFSNDGFDRTWGDTSYWSQYGNWSIWPADSGTDRVDPSLGYPDNLNSWIEYEFDFSGMDDVFIDFGLWYDTEPNYDWMYFCASIDFVNYSCDYWSGYSGGWTDQAYWLTSYAGYSRVWLAWVFVSDYSIGGPDYFGPYVDEVYVYGYSVDTTPPPTPTPDPNGELIQNGSFETGDLTGWLPIVGDNPNTAVNPPADRPTLSTNKTAVPDGPALANYVGVSDTTAVEGTYSAYLWRNFDGNDFLYQPMSIPADVTDITINYWFGIGTYETRPGYDWYCASLTTAGTWDILVDLGCMDIYYTTGYWQEVLYSLSDSEIAAIAGKAIDLNFEMYNRGGDGTGTAAWIDYVRFYATGGSSGSQLDPNEPNDVFNQATPITCDTPVNGVIGDALTGYDDEDWFVISGAITPLDVDIKARTNLANPSALDSMLTLYDGNLGFLAFNDDDGFSYDSFIHYEGAGTTFYIQVESYTGYGGPDSTYELTVTCNGTGQGTAPNDDPTPDNLKAWTIMLYLNGEDPNFEHTLQGYIRNIESFIGSKSAFLNVLVLYDGPQNGDTVRYNVQPNGSYTNGVNRWPRGELNMGDPDTLANFANWAIDLYPAENYYLAVDDHGHGVYGISWDQTNGNDSLTPPEVYSALKDITNNGNRKIDIFDYEACLMGMAENAYDVRQWVDYVIFFEQISWGLNTYPNYFYDLQAGDTPLVVGRRIVDRYFAQANNAGYPHTISLINTGQMANVKQAVTTFGNALAATGNRTAVNNARNNAQAFAASNDATNPVNADYIDLWDLADKTAGLTGVSSAANGVKTAVTNAVVYERHASGNAGGYYWNHSGVHGLSIYYPAFNGSSAFSDYINGRLFQMTEDESGINGRWDEFLVWAVTEGGNGVVGGIGDDDRKGMTSVRFLQTKFGGDTFIYLPVVMK